MPYTVPYVPRERYQSRHVGSIADVIGRQGEAQAQAHRQQGDIAAQRWATVGQAVASGANTIGQQLLEAPVRAQEAEMRDLAITTAREERDGRVKAREDERVLGSALGHATQRRSPDEAKAQLVQLGRGDLVPLFEKTWTELEGARTGLKVQQTQLKALEADYMGTLAAGIKAAGYDPLAIDWALQEAEADGHDVAPFRQLLERAPQQLQGLVESLIEQSPTQRERAMKDREFDLKVTAEERAAETARATAANLVADNERATREAAERAAQNTRENELAQERNRILANRPSGATAPVAVMGPNGVPVYVRPSEALGRRPASTREQGRAVSSGDAGRMAELNSSLDELAQLRDTVLPKGLDGKPVEFATTGTVAKWGASAPNWVTELTGWGADAKSRQGTIDLVKQVIGKTLEDGVLRESDERKYEKIIPTIGDVASVVKTKLDGLERQIKEKRSQFLSALEDAGYDTSAFEARVNAPAARDMTAGLPPLPAGQRYAKAPDGRTGKMRAGSTLPAGWSWLDGKP